MNYYDDSDNNELLNWYEKLKQKNLYEKILWKLVKNWYEICFEKFDIKMIWNKFDMKIGMKIVVKNDMKNDIKIDMTN